MDDYNGAGQIGVNDLLLARGVGGGYGGFGGGFGGGYGGGGSLYTGNNVLAAQAHADGTAVKEAIDCNSDRFNDGLNRVSEQNMAQACNDRTSRITDHVTNQEFRSSDRFAATNKNIADAEFRSLDRQRDIEKAISDNAKIAAECCCDTQKAIADAAKDAAKCCCDAQLQACKDHGELQALIIKENGATRDLMQSTALAAANSRITQLETINALSDNGHRGR